MAAEKKNSFTWTDKDLPIGKHVLYHPSYGFGIWNGYGKKVSWVGKTIIHNPYGNKRAYTSAPETGVKKIAVKDSVAYLFNKATKKSTLKSVAKRWFEEYQGSPAYLSYEKLSESDKEHIKYLKKSSGSSLSPKKFYEQYILGKIYQKKK